MRKASTPASGPAARVGPVFEANDDARAIADVIMRLNVGVSVLDRGSYLRISAPGRCVLTRAAVEAALGRPFRLPTDLEPLMPAFQGRFHTSDDEVVWTYEAES